MGGLLFYGGIFFVVATLILALAYLGYTKYAEAKEAELWERQHQAAKERAMMQPPPPEPEPPKSCFDNTKERLAKTKKWLLDTTPGNATLACAAGAAAYGTHHWLSDYF